MKNSASLLFATLFGFGAVLVACGDDSADGSPSSTSSSSSTTTTTSSGTGGSGGDGGSGGGGGGIPSVPELGAQIDRMGRPAVNTALNDTFIYIDGNGDVAPSDNTVRGASQNAYNANANESAWVATYGPKMALQLGVLDSLDTNCENQLLSCGDEDQATGCYSALANVLADDRLWVRVDGTNCSATAGAYLAVEANATNTITNTDCGGRRPIDDVIRTTYSAVALGNIDGFDDGITAPAGLHPATFPYLATPHIQ